MSDTGAFPANGGAGSPAEADTRPTVVLIHGQPGTGSDWAAVAALLADEYRVLAPDRPGWGSDPRPATGLAANADALEATLEAAGASQQVIAVGHSLGGGVALELALRHPTRVGALVLVGSVGVTGAISGFDRLIALPMVGNGILRAGVATLRGGLLTVTRLSERHPDARVAKRVNDLPILRAALGGDARPAVGRARQSFLVEQRALLAETPALERALARISVPTGVVTGASDRIVPVSAARSLAERVPGAELVVLPGGHLLPFDRPEAIAEVVRRYVAVAYGFRDGPQRRGTPAA